MWAHILNSPWALQEMQSPWGRRILVNSGFPWAPLFQQCSHTLGLYPILHFWCILASPLFHHGQMKTDKETNDSINMGTYCCFSYLVLGAPNFIFIFFKRKLLWLAHHFFFFWNMGIPEYRSTKMLLAPPIPRFIVFSITIIRSFKKKEEKSPDF